MKDRLSGMSDGRMKKSHDISVLLTDKSREQIAIAVIGIIRCFFLESERQEIHFFATDPSSLHKKALLGNFIVFCSIDRE